MASDNLRQTVADVRVKRGAELATDHYLVVGIVQLSSNGTVQKVKSKKMKRIKWEALTDEETRRKFTTKIDQQYSQLSSTETDIESEWLLFRLALMDAATTTCGTKCIGSLYGDRSKQYGGLKKYAKWSATRKQCTNDGYKNKHQKIGTITNKNETKQRKW
jgi:hypothetical protein